MSLLNASTITEFNNILKNETIDNYLIEQLIIEGYEGKKAWLRDWCIKNHSNYDITRIIDDEDTNNTILHKLAYDELNDNIAIFTYLVDNFVISNIDVLNNNGQTPLMLACKRCNIKVIKFLLKHGANKNLKDNNGISVKKYCLYGDTMNYLFE